MEKHGDGGKEIWATEFGVPTTGSHSESEQTRQVTEAFALFHSYPWAGPLLWYSYRDMGKAEGAEDHFGLLRADDSRKPSCADYRAASY